jgi:hypothetical protein
MPAHRKGELRECQSEVVSHNRDKGVEVDVQKTETNDYADPPLGRSRV